MVAASFRLFYHAAAFRHKLQKYFCIVYSDRIHYTCSFSIKNCVKTSVFLCENRKNLLAAGGEAGSAPLAKFSMRHCLISLINLNKSTECAIGGTSGCKRFKLDRYRLNSCVVRICSAVARIETKNTFLFPFPVRDVIKL